MNAYLLMDGALLYGTQEGADVLLHARRVALYDDLGEQAAQVGPVLIPADQESIILARRVLEIGPRSFACNELKCPARLDTLVEHLRQMRHLGTGSETRFYFRYADGRAFDAAWQVLTPSQRTAALGPVAAWDCVNLMGQRQRFVAPTWHRDEPLLPLPLELTPAQWHAMLEHTRIAELHDATLQISHEADPPCLGTPHQQRAWTTQSYRLFARSGIQRPDVRAVANRVIWQSGGRLLSDSLFKQDLRRCEQSSRTEPLLRHQRAYEGLR